MFTEGDSPALQHAKEYHFILIQYLRNHIVLRNCLSKQVTRLIYVKRFVSHIG